MENYLPQNQTIVVKVCKRVWMGRSAHFIINSKIKTYKRFQFALFCNSCKSLLSIKHIKPQATNALIF